METYQGTATAVHAWRYTREDENVATFDAHEAADQWKAVKPSLTKIEKVFGPDNFDLPPAVAREECTVMTRSGD